MTSITPTRMGASSASEWLSAAAAPLSSGSDTHRTEQLATLAFLAASLERQSTLSAPSATLLAALRDALARVPAQLVHLPPTHAAHPWLHLSALAEFLGEPSLAGVILNALAELLGEHDTARGPHDDAYEAERCEVLALCWTRRGRIARVAGALDDAQACFEEALTLIGDAPWRDARLAAELGLINLAVARGNYPLVEQQCSALLASAASRLASVHVAAVYQMRAIARRKRQNWLDALLDSWSAYDQLGHASAYRAELVVSMAETALEAGDLCAAAAGFNSAHQEALATGAQFRVQAAAITGRARTINSCLLAGTARTPAIPADQVESARQSLMALLDAPLAPRERVYALVTMAEWRLREQDIPGARAVLTEASTLAVEHAYFDYQFRTDTLLARLSAADAHSASATPRESVWQEHERHPALVRLAELV
jgi:tetratricopeptide (TPR) repeat protein